MFFGATHNGEKVNISSAPLPQRAPPSNNEWTITTATGHPTQAAPLVAHPEYESDEWLHTPSYARGLTSDGTVTERIYYTANRGVSEDERLFLIRVLQRNEDR